MGDLVRITHVLEIRGRVKMEKIGSTGMLIAAVAIPEPDPGVNFLNGWEVMLADGREYFYEIEMEVINE